MSQYKVCYAIGVGPYLGVQFANELCSVVDGSSMNMACCTSAYDNVSLATFRGFTRP